MAIIDIQTDIKVTLTKILSDIKARCTKKEFIDVWVNTNAAITDIQTDIKVALTDILMDTKACCTKEELIDISANTNEAITDIQTDTKGGVHRYLGKHQRGDH